MIAIRPLAVRSLPCISFTFGTDDGQPARETFCLRVGPRYGILHTYLRPTKDSFPLAVFLTGGGEYLR